MIMSCRGSHLRLLPFNPQPQCLGMAMGRGGPKDGVFASTPHGFVLLYPHPALHDKEPFSPHPHTLRPCETPPHLVKQYIFVNLPRNQYNFFFNKTYFINKNILEIITKFIPSNQINFQQKLNNIIQVFYKRITKKKNLIV